jgi:hypothetical protein
MFQASIADFGPTQIQGFQFTESSKVLQSDVRYVVSEKVKPSKAARTAQVPKSLASDKGVRQIQLPEVDQWFQTSEIVVFDCFLSKN